MARSAYVAGRGRAPDVGRGRHGGVQQTVDKVLDHRCEQCARSGGAQRRVSIQSFESSHKPDSSSVRSCRRTLSTAADGAGAPPPTPSLMSRSCRKNGGSAVGSPDAKICCVASCVHATTAAGLTGAGLVSARPATVGGNSGRAHAYRQLVKADFVLVRRLGRQAQDGAEQLPLGAQQPQHGLGVGVGGGQMNPSPSETGPPCVRPARPH